MQLYNYLQQKMPIVAALGVLFGLSSCGSYQYAGYDDDIYGSSERRVEYQEQRTDRDVEQSNNTYYKNYFSEKSQELNAMAQENEIFTDIDDYESNYAENDSIQFNPQGFAGWGQSNDQVVINVYDNGWNNGGFGFNNYWGFGFNNWGWGNRWNRWNRWGYGSQWANWGWGYDPFWCPPFGGFGYGGFGYGYAYASPYWNRSYRNQYGNGYYSRGLAYNTGRRGNLSNRSSTLSRSNTSAITRRNGNNSRYNITRRSNSNTRGNTTVRRTRSINSNGGTRVNSPRRNNTIRRSNNSVRRSTPTTRRSNTTRRSSSSNNRSYSRSSSSSSRSSGVSRSSSSRSSSSRSSGRRNN